jgi:hypothetical protein
MGARRRQGDDDEDDDDEQAVAHVHGENPLCQNTVSIAGSTPL